MKYYIILQSSKIIQCNTIQESYIDSPQNEPYGAKAVRRSEGWHVGGLTVYADTVPVKRDSNSLGKNCERMSRKLSGSNISTYTYIHTYT